MTAVAVTVAVAAFFINPDSSLPTGEFVEKMLQSKVVMAAAIGVAYGMKQTDSHDY